MKQVNLNEYVKFKLTEKGNEIIEKYFLELSEVTGIEISKDIMVKKDENGYEYMQIWEFMKIFGDHFRNGQTAVTENNNLYFD